MCTFEYLVAHCSDFVGDEDGATAIEYGLIVALVSLAAIVAFNALGSSTTNLHNYVSSSVLGALGGS